MKIIPAILESYRSLKDRTFKIVFETNELNADQIRYLHSCLQNIGYLAFRLSEFSKLDYELLDTLACDKESVEAIGKTKSQQLRHVMYRLWEQKPDGYDDFNQYYDHNMNKLIGYIKKQLE